MSMACSSYQDCQPGSGTCTSGNCCIGSCTTPGQSSVTRSFSSTTVQPGQTVTVTLTVSVVGGETFYALDETVPSGWTITNAGGLDTSEPGHLKAIVLQDAQSTTYSYTVTAPSTTGIYTFSGTYQFEGMGSDATIGGASQVEVTTAAGCSGTCKTNQC